MHRLPVAVLALLALAPAILAENHGRALAPGETVTTYILPAGDADDFVFEAAAGWKVAAAVKNVKDKVLDPGGAWNLAPTLELVAPGGALQSAGVVVKASKTSAKLAATLAAGGRHALRVRGISGAGGCVLSWKLSPPKVAGLKGRALSANEVVEVAVPARGGTLLSWSLKFSGTGVPGVTAVLDPAGADAGFDPLTSSLVKRAAKSESARDFPLPAAGPGGDWKIRLLNRFGPATANLAITVKLPKSSPTSSTLSVAEPVLTGISHATAACGVRVTLTGTDLGSAPRGILFGGHAGTTPEVTAGTSASAAVPGGSGLADVVYVAADGQEAVLPGAFTFRPLPTLTGFDPTFGPGVGSIELHLAGTGFETGGQGLYNVLIGGLPATKVRVLDAEHITCIIPGGTAGAKSVALRDRCGATVTAPGTFSYSLSLGISSVVPEAVPAFGGIPVTIYGTGFAAGDTVRLDGAPVPSTTVLFSNAVIGHRIAGADVPAHAPGAVNVEVTDSTGFQHFQKTGALSYFTFTDATAAAIPAASGTDDWGGVSTAAVDADQDGTIDHLLISDAAALSGVRPGTRLLLNDGAGIFTDATAARMPAPDAANDYGANRILASRFTGGTAADLYLSHAGTGTAARRTSDHKYVSAFGRLLFADGAGGYALQAWEGTNSKFNTSGLLTLNSCWVYDSDFRSVAAAVGDFDGDLDPDLALLNDRSITWYTGSACNYTQVTCTGYYAACTDAVLHNPGSALRIATMGSAGKTLDRTASMLTAAFSATDDFRGVAVAVGDMTGDFLNDIVVTNVDGTLGPTPGTNLSATRIFNQVNTGAQVTFAKKTGVLPVVGAGSDDWRGEAIALPDFNGDFYRDLVVALDADLPNGAPFSTRILVQNPASSALVDRTSSLLTGVLPAGDSGHAKFVLAVDIDKDGDVDLLLSTPGSAGAGNRRTRLLLNLGADEITGLPSFINASSLLPPEASDPGNAVALVVGDIDGDGDLDLVLTDTRQPLATPVKRTRVWRQDR